MNNKQYYVYILFNKKNGTLYVGVTNDLVKRVWQHKNKVVEGFTKQYSIDKLGYYEVCNDINSAIAREKQLKGGKRKAKLELIELNNPNWNDLYYDIVD
jgi:putative endonuclease